MLLNTLSSKTAREGEPVELRVAEPVKVDDLVVIAQKAAAKATITAVHPARRVSVMSVHSIHTRNFTTETLTLPALRTGAKLPRTSFIRTYKHEKARHTGLSFPVACAS